MDTSIDECAPPANILKQGEYPSSALIFMGAERENCFNHRFHIASNVRSWVGTSAQVKKT